ncbi:MAG: hypothetical protein KC482_16635 [Dehalococcoidia bacterium]|nr:hypothetical protein [Dehalococcoidia bacterium]MCA9855181.1 hypothetical protein [Dehalococcoidia bacterium]
MAAPQQLPPELVDALVRAVLQLEEEDWVGEDLRVMMAKVLRLQEQVRQMQEHHRRYHTGCHGPVPERAAKPERPNVTPLHAHDSRMAA